MSDFYIVWDDGEKILTAFGDRQAVFFLWFHLKQLNVKASVYNLLGQAQNLDRGVSAMMAGCPGVQK